jgi:hypothetical protein
MRQPWPSCDARDQRRSLPFPVLAHRFTRSGEQIRRLLGRKADLAGIAKATFMTYSQTSKEPLTSSKMTDDLATRLPHRLLSGLPESLLRLPGLFEPRVGPFGDVVVKILRRVGIRLARHL